MKVKLTNRFALKISIILLAVFSVMKIYRNSYNIDDTSVGGIWNIIGLLFCFIGITRIQSVLSNRQTTNNALKIGLLFTIVSQLHALFFINRLNIRTIYNYICIGYFVLVLIAFTMLSCYVFSNSERKYLLITLASISIISLSSFIQFLTGAMRFLYVSNVYYIVCIFPIIHFITNKKIPEYFTYAVVAVTVILSGKRAALIALALYIFIIAVYRTKEEGKSIIRTVAILVFCFGIFMVIYNSMGGVLNINLLKRLSNLVEDGGSGRDVVYRQALNAIKNSNFVHFIIGHGRYSIGNVINTSKAHNDFLQMMYDSGLFPLLLLVAFYFSLIMEGIKMFKARFDGAPYFLGALSTCIILSSFSNFISSTDYVTCSMACLGLYLGQWSLFKNSIQKTSLYERGAI